MNTDFVLSPEEVEFQETTLHAKLPPFTGPEIFSSNPSTNYLVGKDGAADKNGCLAAYKESLNVGNADSGVVPAHPPNACSNIPKTTINGGSIEPMFLNS